MYNVVKPDERRGTVCLSVKIDNQGGVESGRVELSERYKGIITLSTGT